MNRELKPGVFNITSVCRKDIESILDKNIADSFTDDEMEYLASQMANDYCNQLFWHSLKIIAKNIIDER